MDLPGPIKDMWTFWTEIQRKAMRTVELALVADPGPLRDAWQQILLEGSTYPGRLQVVALDRPEPLKADLALAVLDAESSPLTRSFPVLTGFKRKHLIGILTAAEAEPPQIREVAGALEILPQQVLAAATPEDAMADVTAHITERLHDFLIPLARQFPTLRTCAAWAEIYATAKQNAIVGLLPLPGSDMPLMTANQIKLVLRLAAMHDLPLTKDRLRELLAVVGGGFGMRTVARQAVKFIPGPGWAISSGIGYGGTVAMGKTALEYFKRLDGQSTDASLSSKAAPALDPDDQ